jgi:hypothetical protein
MTVTMPTKTSSDDFWRTPEGVHAAVGDRLRRSDVTDPARQSLTLAPDTELVVLTGRPVEVENGLALLRLQGHQVVSTTRPKPHGDGVAMGVQVRMRTVVPRRPSVTPVRTQGVSPARWYRRRKILVPVVAGAVATLVATGWLAVSLLSLLASHFALVVGGAVLLTLLAVAAPSIGAKCAGLHCPGSGH